MKVTARRSESARPRRTASRRATRAAEAPCWTRGRCPTEDAIRVRAHEIFEERGGVHGQALDDWLQAEQVLHAACEGERQPAESA